MIVMDFVLILVLIFGDVLWGVIVIALLICKTWLSIWSEFQILHRTSSSSSISVLIRQLAEVSRFRSMIVTSIVRWLLLYLLEVMLTVELLNNLLKSWTCVHPVLVVLAILYVCIWVWLHALLLRRLWWWCDISNWSLRHVLVIVVGVLVLICFRIQK